MGSMLQRGLLLTWKQKNPINIFLKVRTVMPSLQESTMGNITGSKKASILKEVTLHILRHAYATHLLEQGVNILTIKRSAWSCTHWDRYLHLAAPVQALLWALSIHSTASHSHEACIEVADVLEAHWSAVQHSSSFNTWQLRTFNGVRRCRSQQIR